MKSIVQNRSASISDQSEERLGTQPDEDNEYGMGDQERPM